MSGEANETLLKELIALREKISVHLPNLKLYNLLQAYQKLDLGTMRRILRKVVHELENLGDTTMLADPTVAEQLIENRVNK